MAHLQCVPGLNVHMCARRMQAHATLTVRWYYVCARCALRTICPIFLVRGHISCPSAGFKLGGNGVRQHVSQPVCGYVYRCVHKYVCGCLYRHVHRRVRAYCGHVHRYVCRPVTAPLEPVLVHHSPKYQFVPPHAADMCSGMGAEVHEDMCMDARIGMCIYVM